MIKDKIYQGLHVSLEKMLDCRERRTIIQQKLLNNYHSSIICLTLNIPGSVKNSAIIEKVFEYGKSLIKQKLNYIHGKVIYEKCYVEETGCEAYFSVEMDSISLKKQMVQIEDVLTIGRIFDIDVLRADGEKISRKDIYFSYRKCFICNKQAQVCARSRAHSIEEIQMKVSEIIEEYFLHDFADRISSIAVKAMLYEVTTTPKPGLVDRSNAGAHKDMDIFTFIDSSTIMMSYFRDCVVNGYTNQCTQPNTLFEVIRYLGQNAEVKMFKATNGVNTHKGIIFSLGLICSALGYQYEILNVIDINKIFHTVTEMLAEIVESDLQTLYKKNTDTFGEEVYLKYGIRGIRGEALTGFSSVKKYGLPILQQYLNAGYSLNDSGVMTLLNLIANVEDTNMIKRSNRGTHQRIQTELKIWIAKQDIYKIDFKRILEIDKNFIEMNISPGGCADLLAITYMVYFLINEELV